MNLTFTADVSANGLTERHFTVGDVPGVLWSPVAAPPGTPILLMGHGGGLSTQAPGVVARARKAVVDDGFHVASIDAPGHGDRPRSPEDQLMVDALRGARERGESLAETVGAFNASIAERAVPEWQATIDALQSLPELGAEVPIGYAGMTLAGAIGIPLAAADPRIKAAVFGGVFAYDSLLAAARRVTIPIEYLLPLDDAEIGREHGLAMFDAFGSKEKTLLGFPESHRQVPGERIDTRFFVRNLTPA